MPKSSYYQYESRQILDALIEADGELTYIEIIRCTGISTMIAVSVLGDLLRSEKIIYRMENGVQYFRVNENFREQPKPAETYRPRDVDIYLRFRQELKRHLRDHLSVADYASMLAITPKYLTSTVSKVSGKSAHKWIEDETVIDICDVLEHSQLTIKEIAHLFSFPNQSFFGRFFKRKMEISPNEYRQRNVKCEVTCPGIDLQN